MVCLSLYGYSHEKNIVVEFYATGCGGMPIQLRSDCIAKKENRRKNISPVKGLYRK
jgi:hypothetical protein